MDKTLLMKSLSFLLTILFLLSTWGCEEEEVTMLHQYINGQVTIMETGKACDLISIKLWTGDCSPDTDGLSNAQLLACAGPDENGLFKIEYVGPNEFWLEIESPLVWAEIPGSDGERDLVDLYVAYSVNGGQMFPVNGISKNDCMPYYMPENELVLNIQLQLNPEWE